MPRKATVGRITVPAEAWERIFGNTVQEDAQGLSKPVPWPEIDPNVPWAICNRHGFSSPLADLEACPDCYLREDVRAYLEAERA